MGQLTLIQKVRGGLSPKGLYSCELGDSHQSLGTEWYWKLMGIFSSLFISPSLNPGFLPGESKTKKQTTQLRTCVVLHSERHHPLHVEVLPGSGFCCWKSPENAVVWGGGYPCFPLNS